MTDRDLTPTPHLLDDRDDLLAAEYVLGTLGPADWRAARDRAAVDGDFAARVADWEARLAPLNAGFAEVPVPADQLARIEARLFPEPARRRRSWGLWLAGALTAAVLAVVAVQITRAPPSVPGLTATLAAEDGALVFAARYDLAAARLTVTRAQGAPAATGQDYELWAIDAAGVPRSLGLLPSASVAFDVALPPGQVLAVSLEPAGGSPQPVPTGPVLAVATLGA
jgi:anti-sigma-K factor RskA